MTSFNAERNLMNLDMTDLTTLRSKLLQKEALHQELAQHRSEIARDFLGTLGVPVRVRVRSNLSLFQHL